MGQFEAGTKHGFESGSKMGSKLDFEIWLQGCSEPTFRMGLASISNFTDNFINCLQMTYLHN